MDKELVKSYLERMRAIENEIELLKTDRKELDEEYKQKIDLKAVKGALAIAKIRMKVGSDLVEEALEIIDHQT